MAKVNIMCAEADFARMLEIQLNAIGHSTVASEKDADVTIVDLDEFGLSEISGKSGGYIGFTRHLEKLSSDVFSVCKTLLHRPFTMSQLCDAIGIDFNSSISRVAKPDPSLPILNSVTRQFSYGEYTVSLSKNEADILSILLQSHGQAVSRETLATAISSPTDDNSNVSNMVDVYVCYLRKKIDEKLGKRIIHTVRGIGYMIK